MVEKMQDDGMELMVVQEGPNQMVNLFRKKLITLFLENHLIQITLKTN
jgi:hypothetical protein